MRATLLVLIGIFCSLGAWATESIETKALSTPERPLVETRKFGIGFGAGYETATANAGTIYGASRSPSLNARAMYWFDPRIALQLGAENGKHSYNLQPDGPTDVNLFRLLLQAKYYLSTEGLRPHLIAGGGMYWRTDTFSFGAPTTGDNSEKQNALGFNAGFGFEVPLESTHACLQFEGLLHSVAFSDDFDPRFSEAGIPDRTGLWLVAQAALVFNW
jgi:hypothetical protein